MLAVNRSVLQPPSAHCREIHLTAIIRHGTRYPTTKDIKEMQQLHNNVLHNALGEERWLQEIKTQWTMWYTEDMDGRLVQKGVSDLKHSGRQAVKALPFAGFRGEASQWTHPIHDQLQAQVCEQHAVPQGGTDGAVGHHRSGQQVTEAVTVQVGNADTLLPLLTLLGFFKDSEALTSSNYATQTHRSFRTSHMLPYAANLLLVLYD
ncbi:hypothetical protein F2P81_020315 [Scophthalmus maximus]|uniref:Multiple inositol polyphosphate phosphatase 1 n=1 Tax=Scophthalmus maximus TaxID=52904 RepID=A0A6A4SA32_SCOMX|nr:hypothetical protein F2P81_020315 [Scophthalmus maximus]